MNRLTIKKPPAWGTVADDEKQQRTKNTLPLSHRQLKPRLGWMAHISIYLKNSIDLIEAHDPKNKRWAA